MCHADGDANLRRHQLWHSESASWMDVYEDGPCTYPTCSRTASIKKKNICHTRWPTRSCSRLQIIHAMNQLPQNHTPKNDSNIFKRSWLDVTAQNITPPKWSWVLDVILSLSQTCGSLPSLPRLAASPTTFLQGTTEPSVGSTLRETRCKVPATPERLSEVQRPPSSWCWLRASSLGDWGLWLSLEDF